MQIDWANTLEIAMQIVLLCAVIGPVSFVIGERLPRKWFDYRAFPYAPFRFEEGGRFYKRLGVQAWKDRAPDMSKMIRGVFKKKLPLSRDSAYLQTLVRETCVAEFVHLTLILISPIFFLLVGGMPGLIATLLYMFLNLPFIIIQRYNRPRLVMIMEREVARRASKTQ